MGYHTQTLILALMFSIRARSALWAPLSHGGFLSICIWDASGGFIKSTSFIEDLGKMRVRVVCE